MESSSKEIVDKDAFKDAVILITIIIPLLISVIALFQSYYIPTNNSLYANQTCKAETQFNSSLNVSGCVASMGVGGTIQEFSNLELHLGQLLTILFLLIILVLGYLLFAKGRWIYGVEALIAIVIIWELIFLAFVGFNNSAIYIKGSGISVNSIGYFFFHNTLFVYNTTNEYLNGDFFLWYELSFIIMFIELGTYTIKRAWNAFKKINL